MTNALDFRRCFFSLLQVLNVDKRIRFVMTLWAIWRRCNDKIWEGVLQPVAQGVRKVMDHFHEWS